MFNNKFYAPRRARSGSEAAHAAAAEGGPSLRDSRGGNRAAFPRVRSRYRARNPPFIHAAIILCATERAQANHEASLLFEVFLNDDGSFRSGDYDDFGGPSKRKRKRHASPVSAALPL